MQKNLAASKSHETQMALVTGLYPIPLVMIKNINVYLTVISRSFQGHDKDRRGFIKFSRLKYLIVPSFIKNSCAYMEIQLKWPDMAYANNEENAHCCKNALIDL